MGYGQPTLVDKIKEAIMKVIMRAVIPITVLVVVLMMLPFMFGINDAGERTVVQYPSGTLYTKFSPGVYPKFFGKTTEYNDFITFDFDKQVAKGRSTLDQKGISVRYQDGGMGTVFGKARYALPTDEGTMLNLHRAFRSNQGLANKLIKPVTEEGMNLTAGLMKSEEAYATKRAIFTQMAKAQIGKGPYVTELKTIRVKDEVSGKTVLSQIPVVALDEKQMAIHNTSDLAEYGITVPGFQLNDPGFEPSTMAQIAKKRGATMDIITAKANAEKAKQTAITAEEDGKAAVMTAKYVEEVLKEKALVAAAREKEVAVITAKRKVEVAEQAKLEALVIAQRKVEVAGQSKLEAEQRKLESIEYKQEQVNRGEGDAAYKRLVMQADGALEQKLAAYVEVNKNFAREFGKQKWVPEVSLGGTGEGSAAMTMVDMLMVKTAKDLALDMNTATK